MLGFDRDANIDRRSYLAGSAVLSALPLGVGSATAGEDDEERTKRDRDVKSIDDCGTITEPGYYRLTDDITVGPGETGIEIRASDVTLDGNGYAIIGREPTDPGDRFPFEPGSAGVLLRPPRGRRPAKKRGADRCLSNVRIEDFTVENFYTGIAVYDARKTKLVGTTVTNNEYGFVLFQVKRSALCRNRVADNEQGVYLLDSSKNALANNEVRNNRGTGVWLDRFGTGSNTNLLRENTVERNRSGGVRLTESDRNIVRRNAVDLNISGISLDDARENTIAANHANNDVIGIALFGGERNTVADNEAPGNDQGIVLSESHRNTISGNDAAGTPAGIGLSSSNNNTLEGNTASALSGIILSDSHRNVLEGNHTEATEIGFRLSESHENRLDENTAERGRYGYRLTATRWNRGRGNEANDYREAPIEIIDGEGNEIEVNGTCYTEDEFSSRSAPDGERNPELELEAFQRAIERERTTAESE